MLNAIYEEGFRPERGQHDALDALSVAISETRVNWILDADIRDFFDGLSQSWLVRFLAHRVSYKRIIRLVRKWLKAGVLENGECSVSETGTPQGAVVSPLLANIYLHYVFDLWAKQWRRREATGNVIFVRYADDIVAGFENEADARRFWEAMRARFVHWYNHEHRHSGIRYVSPAQRHAGQDQAILAARHELYPQARQRHPCRWSGHTRDWSLITSVTLNLERDALVSSLVAHQDKRPMTV